MVRLIAKPLIRLSIALGLLLGLAWPRQSARAGDSLYTGAQESLRLALPEAAVLTRTRQEAGDILRAEGFDVEMRPGEPRLPVRRL
ncbi:MAG: hypothetical protein H5T70_02290, partial [Chloroflexi bacterium]|nr:hypothetical protein [Chloroflexota bacterium]